jgi:Zn-dependent protease with chaperone function
LPILRFKNKSTMRFFDHQATARSRSLRLTLAFWLVVVLTVLTAYAAVVGAWLLIGHWPRQPWVHGAVVGAVLLMIAGGWWLETSAIAQGSARFARRMGARELQTANSFAEQRLANVVAEVTLSAQMRRPRVMLLPRVDEINAFALGLTPADWTVVVTQGALTHLTRRELQGLVAHECSHLKEGDTRLNMRLLGMVGGLGMVHGYGEWLCRWSADTERGVFVPVWVFGLLVQTAGFAGWLGGRLLQAATSREREFLADARAVQWTRDVDGLGGVLRKVMSQQIGQTVNRANRMQLGPMHAQGMVHLLLVEWDERSSTWTERLASHPSLDERVTRLYGDTQERLPLLAIDERTGEVRRGSPATVV